MLCFIKYVVGTRLFPLVKKHNIYNNSDIYLKVLVVCYMYLDTRWALLYQYAKRYNFRLLSEIRYFSSHGKHRNTGTEIDQSERYSKLLVLISQPKWVQLRSSHFFQFSYFCPGSFRKIKAKLQPLLKSVVKINSRQL